MILYGMWDNLKIVLDLSLSLSLNLCSLSSFAKHLCYIMHLQALWHLCQMEHETEY